MRFIDVIKATRLTIALLDLLELRNTSGITSYMLLLILEYFVDHLVVNKGVVKLLFMD